MTLHHTEKIIWTVLPNGIAPGKGLQLSVFISPRLLPDPAVPSPTLGLFPDFLDWPAVVTKMGFGVQFAGAPPLPARPAYTPDKGPNSALWKALFSSSTHVRPHAFDDYSNRFIHSYPVQNLLSFVKEQYQQLGGNVQLDPTTGLQQLPPIVPAPGGGPQGTLSAFLDQNVAVPEDQVGRELGGFLNGYKSTKSVPPGPPDLRHDVLQARWFHYAPPIGPGGPSRPPPTDLDFHRIVSALGEYPAILRLLGLIVDLIVPLSPGIPSAPDWTSVQLIPGGWTPKHLSGQLLTGTSIRPKTAYVLDATGFRPRPRAKPGDTPIKNGMLDLSDPNTFNLMEVDADGTMFKIVNFSSQLLRVPAAASSVNPGRTGAPALRSPGIAIIYTGRASNQALSFQYSTQNNDTAEKTTTTTLYAEDVARGYRIDVQDISTTTASAPWRSLCLRRGTYSFPTAPPALRTLHIDDEGIVSTATTTKPAIGPDLYLHESIIRWTGWSLVAQRPGKAIDAAGNPMDLESTPHPGLEFAANFHALPGSLPRMRYGHWYRLRARVVDLAGNSALFTSSDEAEATPGPGNDPLMYRRFEPVEAPAILFRRAITHSPGDAAHHLVVRSDFDKTDPTLYVKFLASLGYPGLNPDSQRHIAPPKTSELMAETHGMFDTPSGRVDPSAYSNIHVSGIESGIGFATTASGKPVNGLDNLDGVFASSPKGDSAVYDTDQLPLPYMPDPIARGAAFVGLPGTPATPGYILHKFTGAWPYLLPFRLQVVGIPAGRTPRPPSYRESPGGRNGVLTVELPQAEMVTVNLSSFFAPGDLDLMGIWGWIEEWIAKTSPPAGTEDHLRALALTGRHWMLTPFIELTLVHAVQRPLKQPDFQTINGTRNIGDTVARISGIIPIEGKSTVKVAVDGRWTENWDDPAHDDPKKPGPGDDVNNPGGPGPLKKNSHAFQLPVQPTDTALQFSQEHHFGDTRHRMVFYQATGTSRFREYFPKEGVDSGKISLTRAGAEVQLDILSSARPDAPNLLYTVPAFGWSSSVPDAPGTSVLRTGRRLRVYMNRPWYSSGDDELLGVICLPGSGSTSVLDRISTAVRAHARRLSFHRQDTVADPLETTLKPYITMWGNDPIWGFGRQQILANPPSALNFPLAVNRRTGVTVEGLPGVLLDVAGHQVGYDAGRKLWYADIELDAGPTYFPFVRLALARYQPHSVQQPSADGTQQDVFISRIVLSDFAQLAPDRLANVISDPNDNKRVSVFVHGPMFTRSAVGSNFEGDEVYDTSTTMDVTIEEQAPNGTGDLGWMPVGNPYLMTATATANGPQVHWMTSFELPTARGQRPFRLVIKEYERFYVSPPSPSDTPGTARRVVYASTLDI